jgi:hypothetical protein
VGTPVKEKPFACVYFYIDSNHFLQVFELYILSSLKEFLCKDNPIVPSYFLVTIPNSAYDRSP